MTDPLAGWLLFGMLPSAGGAPLRSSSYGRGGSRRLGRELTRLGLGCPVMAGFFYVGVTMIEEQLESLLETIVR